MKISITIQIMAGVLMLECTGNKPQALIDQWNADFEAQKQACEDGNAAACQSACQMSIHPQICETVKADADMTDAKQRAWVEQCTVNAAKQGAAVCALAGLSATLPPVETHIPSGTPATRDPLTPDEQAQMHAAQRLNEAEKKEEALKAALMRASQDAEEARQGIGNASDNKNVAAPPPAETLMPGDKAEVPGSLSAEVIRRVARTHHTALQRCYETGLAVRPNIEGNVSVRFIISGTGTVQTVAISESTLKDPTVENCVLAAFARMVFPAPEGGGSVTVTYPVHFKPADK